jgi:hypothetical protein
MMRICAALVLLTSVAASASAQEIVFSRRVYAAQGTTYQQLWTWSASDGTLKQRTNSARNHNAPACSPDGKQIFFSTSAFDKNGALVENHWSLDRATGIESPAKNVSARPATPAGNDNEEFPSPDGKTALVGTYGESSTSTSHYQDYFLVDVATTTRTRAMSGNNPVWLPNGNAIVYETPRDLAPLPPDGAHSVWSAHLALFDLTTHKSTTLTSGVTNNVQPTLCGR